MLSTVWMSSSCTTHLIRSPANSLWSETPGVQKSAKINFHNIYETEFIESVPRWACVFFALTSVGFALPGVVAGHLAVSSLRQSPVEAALGLTVEISILDTNENKLRFHNWEIVVFKLSCVPSVLRHWLSCVQSACRQQLPHPVQPVAKSTNWREKQTDWESGAVTAQLLNNRLRSKRLILSANW